MAKLYVTDMDGNSHVIDADPDGASIMDILMRRGFEVGLCGGNCSCGTCLAAVDSEWLAKIAPPRKDEKEMLETGMNHIPQIRLTCQIPFVESLNGIRLTLVALE